MVFNISLFLIQNTLHVSNSKGTSQDKVILDIASVDHADDMSSSADCAESECGLCEVVRPLWPGSSVTGW